MIILLFIYLFSLKWPNPTFPPSWLGKSNTLTLFGKTRIKPTYLNLCPFRQGATRAFFFLFIYLFIYYYLLGWGFVTFCASSFSLWRPAPVFVDPWNCKISLFRGGCDDRNPKVWMRGSTRLHICRFCCVFICVMLRFLNGGFLFVILEIT